MSNPEAVRDWLGSLEEEQRIDAINELRQVIHEVSPFAQEPVDMVRWVPMDKVVANDYNPNAVAPPEMLLLETSITADGYTQPIVAWAREDGMYEVVDGFHRNRVGRESLVVNARVKGHLPLAVINRADLGRGDRIAATIRHNRARGKHAISAMSDIVVELKRRNWSDKRIAENLGMDQDEILRLMQINGLGEMFSDQDFSTAWDIQGHATEADLADELLVDEELPEGVEHRVGNTSDPDRVFHTFDKWECYRAGLYATTKDGMTRDEAEAAYADFLRDPARFGEALDHVVSNWKYSCEHYLTNTALNRIAWLGQASAAYALGLPAMFRGGYRMLTEEEQAKADELALIALNKWSVANGRAEVNMREAGQADRQVDLY